MFLNERLLKHVWYFGGVIVGMIMRAVCAFSSGILLKKAIFVAEKT